MKPSRQADSTSKWIANESDILANVPRQDHASSSTLLVDDRTTHHTLGIRWNRHSDRFVFSAPSLQNSDVMTKRSVLSFIARMFDPLGWLSPIIITAKVFMQELWAIRLDWDEELSSNLRSRWLNFRNQLDNVTTISIPRWFGTRASALAVELHGFSDASQSALAAVVFLRILNELDDIRVILVSAKTKVAPLKRMTIPRLELAAAVLVRQVLKIRDVLELHHVPTHL
ncbi:gag-pol polyprotein precursor [Lasius niger]|uniref:Gag-pol polyprotein n=1 Tax=Lasius niger TaxID=67767 RepID=A0A0J7KJ96_LASNI|nr:gag-pol polyprotein precursor [Lasius niger]